jgi:uncharacterized protein (DUF2336 family)
MSHNFVAQSNATFDRRSSSFDDRTAIAAERQSLIDELESVLASPNISSRAEVLRRVTDLFVTGCDRFDGEQLALFDDVMSRLVDEIEKSARAAFGGRLAKISNAPPKVSRMLALDDSIEVAGELLMHSEQLDEETLIAGAKTKSQRHLLAISRRKILSEGITDVLVERGDRQVVGSAAANAGARFSPFGYSTLIMRSEADEGLAQSVWARREIPRAYLLALFETASESVRLTLEAADRTQATLIREMIKQAANKLQMQTRNRSPEFLAAQAKVQSLHQAGALNEDRLCEFAQTGRFDETVVALMHLSDLPIGVIERALVLDHSDQVLVIAKSIGLSWNTTKAILAVQSTDNTKSRPTRDFEQCFANFKKLKPETAKTAIQFYRLRERAATARSN